MREFSVAEQRYRAVLEVISELRTVTEVHHRVRGPHIRGGWYSGVDAHRHLHELLPRPLRSLGR
jgi:hypothetical protein